MYQSPQPPRPTEPLPNRDAPTTVLLARIAATAPVAEECTHSTPHKGEGITRDLRAAVRTTAKYAHNRKLPFGVAESEICHWRRSALSAHDPALAKARPGFDRNISAVIAFFPPTMISQVFSSPDRLTPVWRGAWY